MGTSFIDLVDFCLKIWILKKNIPEKSQWNMPNLENSSLNHYCFLDIFWRGVVALKRTIDHVTLGVIIIDIFVIQFINEYNNNVVTLCNQKQLVVLTLSCLVLLGSWFELFVCRMLLYICNGLDLPHADHDDYYENEKIFTFCTRIHIAEDRK